jgi:hypothetical protein
MEEHASRQVRCSQIVEQLASRVLLQFVRGLYLEHDTVVDDHIEALLAELLALVHHGDPDLASNLVPSRQQLALESLEVKMLEEAVSERVVNLEERTDDGVDQILEYSGRSAHAASSQVYLSRPSSFSPAAIETSAP